MANPKKSRRAESTILVPTGAAHDRITATQVMSAAEARRQKGKRAGESSVILPAGERIRRTGLGVSIKFAFAISAVVAVSMLLFGLVIDNAVKDALNDEIDAAGVHAARVLAVPDMSMWNIFHRAYQGTPHGGFEDQIARGEYRIPENEITAEQKRIAEERIEANRHLLQELVAKDGRVLDALISRPDRKTIVRVASGRPRLEFAGQQVEVRDGVAVEYGTYTPPGGQPLNARSYVAPIRSAAGTIEGYATIVLSEKSIQAKLADVRRQVLALALVFVALGVGVAFLMGNRITRPIQSLTRDVEVIAGGDLDHRPRVHSKDEIGVLARTVDLMTRSLKDAQGRQVEHEKQKHQLAVALEIQSNLLPKSLPKLQTFEVESHYTPGPEVGGDYYDVFTLPDGRLFLMVASASGKGIPAAMLVTMARSFTSAVAEREPNAAEILRSVNRLLSPDLRRGMYVTALACVLDPRTGRLVIANAGHNPLVFYEGATKEVRPVHADGIALGFDKGPVFDRSLREVELEMQPQDRIVLCTPGVFALRNHEGRELGEESFYRLVAREGAKNSTAFVNLVAHTVTKFAEAGSIESDVTFVTVKRLA